MKTIVSDVLIIGSGAAGLRAAIEAKKEKANVLLVSKGPIGLANCTAVSGGWLAAAFKTQDSSDSPECHFKDTIIGGKFLNNQRLVKIFVNEAPFRVMELEKFGVKLVRKNGKIFQGFIPEHSYPRAISITGHSSWAFPADFGPPLSHYLTKVIKSIGVKTLEKILIVDLIHDEKIQGAIGFDLNKNDFIVFNAKAVVIATGGGEQIFKMNDVPKDITGDGIAIAYRTGAELIDMEFIQFYAPIIIEENLPRWHLPYHILLSKGLLLNSNHENILELYGIKDIKKLGRDKLTKILGIEFFIKGSSLAFLDLTNVPEEFWKDKVFSRFKELMLRFNVDIRKKPIKVSAASHYFMGGIKINEQCETNLLGLFSAGEVTGGIHGANRIGGNSLSECIVFGARAGFFSAKFASLNRLQKIDLSSIKLKLKAFNEFKTSKPNPIGPRDFKHRIQNIMWKHGSIVRNENSLKKALEELNELENEFHNIYAKNPYEFKEALEAMNMLIVSKLILTSALLRKESRGAHFRMDYPKRDDKNWLKNIVLKSINDKLSVLIKPVVKEEHF